MRTKKRKNAPPLSEKQIYQVPKAPNKPVVHNITIVEPPTIYPPSAADHLDIQMVAYAFGLQPGVCAHDLIGALERRLRDHETKGRHVMYEELSHNKAACGLHPLAAGVTYKSRSYSPSPTWCGSCEAALFAKRAVFADIEGMFADKPKILAKIHEMKKAHGAWTWEDDLNGAD